MKRSNELPGLSGQSQAAEAERLLAGAIGDMARDMLGLAVDKPVTGTKPTGKGTEPKIFRGAAVTAGGLAVVSLVAGCAPAGATEQPPAIVSPAPTREGEKTVIVKPPTAGTPTPTGPTPEPLKTGEPVTTTIAASPVGTEAQVSPTKAPESTATPTPEPKPAATPTSYPVENTREVGIGGQVGPKDRLFTAVRLAPVNTTVRTIRGDTKGRAIAGVIEGDQFIPLFEWDTKLGWQRVDETGRILGPVSYRRVTSTRGLNLRQSPSVSDLAVDTLSSGQELIALELDDEDGWIKVLGPQGIAFATTEFLSTPYNYKEVTTAEKVAYEFAQRLANERAYYGGDIDFKDIEIVQGRDPARPIIVTVGEGEEGFTREQAQYLAETVAFMTANSPLAAASLDGVRAIVKLPDIEEWLSYYSAPDFLGTNFGQITAPGTFQFIAMKDGKLVNPDNYGPGGKRGKVAATLGHEGVQSANHRKITELETFLKEIDILRELQDALSPEDFKGYRENIKRNAEVLMKYNPDELKQVLQELDAIQSSKMRPSRVTAEKRTSRGMFAWLDRFDKRGKRI